MPHKRKSKNKQTNKNTVGVMFFCSKDHGPENLQGWEWNPYTYSGIPTAVIFYTFAEDLKTKFGKQVDVLYEAALGGVKSIYFIHPSRGNSANW